MTTKLVLTIAVDGTPVVTGKVVIDDSAVRRYSTEEFQKLLEQVAVMVTGQKAPDAAAPVVAKVSVSPPPDSANASTPSRSKPVSVLKKRTATDKKKPVKRGA